MNRYILAAIGVVLGGMALWLSPGLTITGFAENDKMKHSERPIPGRYIVVLEDWAGGERGHGSVAESVAEDISVAHQVRVDHVFKHAVNGFSVKMSEKRAEALSRDPRVKYVEEDGEFFESATQNNATWGLDRIDQRNLPLTSTYNYDSDGANVRAYIIDTGIRASHTEFGGRVSGGFSAIEDGIGTDDCRGHGTHVAGTVGGNTYGVAKNVSLVPVRVLDCQGSGTTATVIAGVDYVIANNDKPAVANMSLGGPASETLDTAVNNAVSGGVTFVVAAGNSNTNACYSSPARAGSAITVGSTTNTDARSSFSNYGSCLDIFAPGSSVTSAWHTDNAAVSILSGTSMASPHVAGVVALYLQVNPTATSSSVATALFTNASTGKVSNAGKHTPNRLLYSIFGITTPSPTPTPTPSGISLSVVARKQQGIKVADLRWSGASGSVVYHRDSQQFPTANDGFETDNTGQRGGGSATYRVCETATTNCSAPVTVTW